MAQATINLRMDAALKKDMESICKAMGMNLTTAFTIFAKKVTSERRIPFEVSAPDPFYSEANQKRLKESIAQLESGNCVVKSMEELEMLANE
ncbi:MAG: type II toxin-antitoxin system RelB/DinJ family antitoxin [Selenomonadaceae bacterium]|nr:type II toxin-antitoxin system RelB/DinJ family antitoxin [Selenomonadaceae bacterium]MBR4695484.1 type II toxin-antitoxin system RelB/DinJ family antitoxin [Selenomonadaceae bacterium]